MMTKTHWVSFMKLGQNEFVCKLFAEEHLHVFWHLGERTVNLTLESGADCSSGGMSLSPLTEMSL